MELSSELLATLQSSVRETSSAETLPPRLYCDPDFFAFEREAIFSHEWLCVGRTDPLRAPGDFYCVDMVGEPLVVVRGKDDEVRVLSSVCQHRAMVVAEGSGNCSTFKCPYHHWIYALDGRLLGAPAMERAESFEKQCYSLPAIKTEIWHGFVFVNFDAAAPPLSPTLAAFEPYLENFEPASLVTRPTEHYPHLPWNWKVMLENFNDGYHASRLHQGVHDFCPSENAQFMSYDPTSNAIIRTNRFTHADGGFNAYQKALLPIFPGLSAEERSRVTFAVVPPTLMLGLAPDQIFYFLLRPIAANEIDLEIGYLFHPSCAAHPLFEELFELSSVGVRGIVNQDIHATTLVQRGLSSRFAGRGRYAWQEEVQRQLNCWLVDRYRAFWPGAQRAEPIHLLEGTPHAAAAG